MPSITTHNIFAKEVFKSLNKSVQGKLQSDILIYEMFSQSFDFFYFYNLRDFKNGKKYRKLGTYCHKSNTQLYLINIVDNMIKMKLNNDPQALAYLYGSINHYCLDTICHPFVFYKTGIYNSQIPETKKYKGLHTKMEKAIDAYYYEKYYNKPFYKYNIVKEIIPKIKLSKPTTSLFDTVFKATYNKANIADIFMKSYRNSRIIYRLSTFDRYGIKKKLYYIADKLMPFKNGNFVNWSYYNRDIDTSYLNNEKITWCHPCDNDIIYNTSFEDLFELARKKAVNIIAAVNKVLNSEENIDTLLELIPNISYASGMLITDKKLMKYFEF